MIEVHVDPGICGLTTNIKVESEDMTAATVAIESECPDIQKLAGELGELDPMKEVFGKFGESTVFQLAQKYCKHATCPVPSAVLKGIEAAAGLALPKDVHLEIKKSE